MTVDPVSATPDAASAPDGAEAAGGGPARRRAAVLLGAVAAVILGADLVTKQLALSALEGRDPVRLFGGAVYLVLTRNSGAAFSLGSSYTWIFPLLTIVAVGWIAWFARGLRSMVWAAALGLVLGGAVGNLTDRLFRAPGPFLGHVVDFVSLFDDAGRVWPVFNVADSALCVGLGLVLLLELTGRRRDGTRATSSGTGPADAPAGGTGDDGARDDRA